MWRQRLGQQLEKLRKNVSSFTSTLSPSAYGRQARISLAEDAVDVESLPEFNYIFRLQPKSFRLLCFDGSTITLSDGTKQKTCRLEEFSLAESPRFNALSYTWGAPSWDLVDEPSYNNDEYDWVIGRVGNLSRMKIGRNLYEALQQMSESFVEDSKVWIDAICINQQDKKEKSEQVSIMGDIYARCKYATIWLGKFDAVEAAQIMQLHEQVAKPVISYLQQHGENSIALRSWTFEELAQVGIVLPVDLLLIYEKLLRRMRWFTRVWIFQEVNLAPEAAVALAHVWLPFQAMAGLSWFLRSTGLLMQVFSMMPTSEQELWANGPRHRHPLALLDMFWQFGTAIRTKWRGWELHSPHQLKMNLNPESPFEIYDFMVNTLQRSASSDPRDHCYAALSIAQHGGFDLEITPDYSHRVARVFTDISDLFLRNLPGLAFLGASVMRASTLKDLPSWARDFAIPSHSLNAKLYNASQDPNGVDVEDQPGKFVMAGSRLIVSGKWISKVKEIFQFYGPEQKTAPAGYPPGLWSDLGIILQCVEHLIDHHGVYNDDPLEVLWRTFKANDTSGIYHRPLSNEDFQSYIISSILQSRAVQMVEQERGKGGKLPDISFVEEIHDTFHLSAIMPTREMIKELIDPFMRHQQGTSSQAESAQINKIMAEAQFFHNTCSLYLGESRCVFVTEEGYVGLGPNLMRVEDDVIFIETARKLFIMRQDGDEYIMVGDAYVHGLMNGELKKKGMVNDLEDITIC